MNMITIDLAGKAILITGALGAIAEHMVRRLTEAGATLVLTDIKGEEEARKKVNDGGKVQKIWFVLGSNRPSGSQSTSKEG